MKINLRWDQIEQTIEILKNKLNLGSKLIVFNALNQIISGSGC